MWLSVHHPHSIWQAAQPLRYLLAQAGAAASSALTVLCWSPPGLRRRTPLCVGFPPTEHRLCVSSPSHPSSRAAFIMSQVEWLLKIWLKNVGAQPPSPQQMWLRLSLLGRLSSCCEASTSVFVCADLSWTQLIYEMYPKQSCLTSKRFFFFFFASWELNYGGYEGFEWLVFFWFYSVFLKIRSKCKYREFPSCCIF